MRSSCSGGERQMTVVRTPRRFRARSIPRPNKPSWDISTVTIFDGATEVGSYERNYANFAEDTFEPFELNGAWYALYSRDYTSTRVMSLPDCRDLGGEEPQAHGFCPVEYFVPRYKSVVQMDRAGNASESWKFEKTADVCADEAIDQLDPWKYLTLAFVAGCLWGDDSSWKLQVIDVSRAKEGILLRTERFGYLQVAKGQPIAELVRLHRDLHEPLRAEIIQRQIWNVDTGTLVDPFE
jgi:hypothetical protein